MATSEEIFEHHLEAFGAGDIEQILVDYAPDAIMIHNDRVWRGHEGAREYFARWLNDLIPPGSRFDIIDRQIVDDIVFISWTAESEKYEFDYGTDTFLVQGSKIVRQTVATHHRAK